MAKRKQPTARFSTEPLTPMNAWVREALEHSGHTLQEVADELTAQGLGAYNRSQIQKMTTVRRIRLEEAAAISRFTDYPLPRTLEREELTDLVAQLSRENQDAIRTLVQSLLAAQEGRKSDE